MLCNELAILVVDDDVAICQFITDGLADEGYQCEIALDAEDALTKLRRRNFDIALLDIKLPGQSGIDLLKSFESLNQAIVVLMMTAVKDFETAVKAMQLGASNYLVKPFTIVELVSCVVTALERRNRRDTVISMTRNSRGAVRNEVNHSDLISEMNAIAFGVEAKVDHFDFHSQIVTERTVHLARQLGLPDRDIGEWMHLRTEQYSKRNNYIKSLLRKLESSPVAQALLGMASPIRRFPRSEGERN